MRRRQGLTLGLAVAVAMAGAALARPDGGGGSRFEPAARIIDRTFRCTPIALGVTVDAVPVNAIEVFRQEPSPGFIGVTGGGRRPGSELVAIRARRWERYRTTANSWQGAYASTARCASLRRHMPLSPRGLPGPPIQWMESQRCLVRGRVLVRFRALLRSPASWRRISPSYAGARSNVVDAALALRRERTGKPIAYMELERDGKTKLWYSPAACR
jgi:hypothetical protein